MRIGLIIYGSLDTLSGGYLYDRQLVAALRRAGHEVVLFSQAWGGYGRLLRQNGDRRLPRRVAAARCDLLLQDELNHPSLFLLNRRLRKLVPVPIISIVHHLRSSERHPAPLLPLYRAVERTYLRGVDGFIFNSETSRRAVAALLGRSLPPHVVAVPGPNPALAPAGRVRERRPGAPLRLLFVGNLQPRKGLHVLLRALARLPRESWVLDVVGATLGDAGYGTSVADLVPAGGAVRWHGRLDDAALTARYAVADVLCVPSDYEGYGIVYLEGMQAGCVPVGTSAGAAAEVIGDQAGLLVPPGDPAALAQALWMLYSMPERVRSLSAAALARAAAHPGWDVSMGAAAAFLERIAGA